VTADATDTRIQKDLNRSLLAQIAAVTGGLAPDDYLNAWWEWYLNLATHPDRQQTLFRSALEKLCDTWLFFALASSGRPLPPGRPELGFTAQAWNLWPYNTMARAYANWAHWWREALAAAGSSPNLKRAGFAGQLLIDAASPLNFLPTNPELLQKTIADSGRNLVRGARYWLEDLRAAVTGQRTRVSRRYVVGKDVAVTPGKVVFRNRLIELLQYAPRTQSVHAEPVLIMPAWIMKYYILDLAPERSLVRYLVEQGHTVFMISWKNPGAADRDLGLDDYLQLGFLDALAAVTRIVPNTKVHAAGYCIGGTLLAIGAALLAGRGDTRLATVSLLASLVDFSEPGELSVFISPSQVALLEALMHRSGVLESERMSAAFALLRSRDLLWKPAVQTYFAGERPKLTDLMAWNADGTRMPWRMHSEYLELLYLRNSLARGELIICGQRIDLAAIRSPMFVVGTEADHVTPWRSVYRVRNLTSSTDYTFLLTTAGHNGGIVSGPTHPKRKYRVLELMNDAKSPVPDEWLRTTPTSQGSWWPVWQKWLHAHSAPTLRPARIVDAAADLPDAPGCYVRE
jgi:polyhydroxyalkanoate synthase